LLKHDLTFSGKLQIYYTALEKSSDLSQADLRKKLHTVDKKLNDIFADNGQKAEKAAIQIIAQAKKHRMLHA